MEKSSKLVEDVQVREALGLLRKLDSEPDTKLLVDVQEIRLQFTFFKVPNSSTNHTKLLKILLPHMPQYEDVCLFVGDGENATDRTKIDETIHTYEDRLSDLGFTQISEVIPLLKLKLEYQTYESRRALASRFDTFLAEDKVCRFLPSMLGKVFYGKRKHPIQVKLGEKCMARELKKALHTAMCSMSYKGSTQSVGVAHLGMDDEDIVENVQAAIAKVAEGGPGGSSNLHSFHLALRSYPPLPLYISEADRSTVKVPMLPEHESSLIEEELEEVSTVKGKVAVGHDGTITIVRRDGTVTHIGGGGEEDINLKRKAPKGKEGGASKKSRKTRAAVDKNVEMKTAGTPKQTKRDASKQATPKQPKQPTGATPKPATNERSAKKASAVSMKSPAATDGIVGKSPSTVSESTISAVVQTKKGGIPPRTPASAKNMKKTKTKIKSAAVTPKQTPSTLSESPINVKTGKPATALELEKSAKKDLISSVKKSVTKSKTPALNRSKASALTPDQGSTKKPRKLHKTPLQDSATPKSLRSKN